jgi:DNA-binding NtrC family response regulator
LRERREDIPLLATHFLGKCNKKMGKHLAQLSGTALQEMMTYHWPGNIRELEHVIEQSVITSPGKSLELARPLRLTKASIFPLEEMGQSPLKSLADNEREHILRVLNSPGDASGVRAARPKSSTSSPPPWKAACASWALKRSTCLRRQSKSYGHIRSERTFLPLIGFSLYLLP